MCVACGEVCEERKITVALPRGDSGIAMFKNVPAEVCPRCGEPRFSLKTTSRLIEVVKNGAAPNAMAQVPVFDLAAV